MGIQRFEPSELGSELIALWPEDDGDGHGDPDGGHEGVGASIVAGVDAAPFFDAAEACSRSCGARDRVPDREGWVVSCLILRGYRLPYRAWRGVAELVGIVPLVAEQHLGAR